MIWIAPDVTRVDEPLTGDERATLDGLLDEPLRAGGDRVE